MMSEAHRDRAAERIPIELIEADFEIAFNLIDMSQAPATARFVARRPCPLYPRFCAKSPNP
jgi:hypothetical protein